jgi:hypothetical protein
MGDFIHHEFEFLPDVRDILRLVQGEKLYPFQKTAIIGSAALFQQGMGIIIFSIYINIANEMTVLI